jgi:hypothetical protein
MGLIVIALFRTECRTYGEGKRSDTEMTVTDEQRNLVEVGGSMGGRIAGNIESYTQIGQS